MHSVPQKNKTKDRANARSFVLCLVYVLLLERCQYLSCDNREFIIGRLPPFCHDGAERFLRILHGVYLYVDMRDFESLNRKTRARSPQSSVGRFGDLLGYSKEMDI